MLVTFYKPEPGQLYLQHLEEVLAYDVPSSLIKFIRKAIKTRGLVAAAVMLDNKLHLFIRKILD